MSSQPLVFQQPFDARQYNPAEAFQPVPAGDYRVIIESSGVERTKDGQGGYLELKLKIMDGPYAGRTLKWNLNLYNNSSQAVDIAYRQLSAICHVTGVMQLQSSQQLHGIPFLAVVAIQTGGQYNDVKGCKYLDGSAPGKPGQAQVGAGQPQGAQPTQWPQQPAQGAPAQPQWQPPQQPQQPQQPQWGPPGQPPQQTQPPQNPQQPQWGPPPPQQTQPQWGPPPPQQTQPPTQQPIQYPPQQPAQPSWGPPPTQTQPPQQPPQAQQPPQWGAPQQPPNWAKPA